MNFDFSDEQKELRDLARRFLKDQCGPEIVRGVLEGAAPYDGTLWKGVIEQGWTATALPEEYGGIGIGYLELCVIAEELGRVTAPIPFSSSVYLASEALLLAGSDEQKSKYLSPIGSGETIATVALAEGAGDLSPDGIATAFQSGALKGTKIAVPDGDVASIAIVLARGAKGPALALVDLTQPGVKREAVKTVDPTRSHATIQFDAAKAEPLGADGAGWEIARHVMDRAAVLFAFEQLGGATAAMEMARNYAIERYAFGRPIGSFQAIKHRMADMFVKNELARSNCYHAAWALSTDAPELPVAAASARVAATEAYHFASKENIQVHGGMGFTWEADCQFHYRRARLLGLNLGGVQAWKDRLVGALEAGAVA
jgi:alkylation response protein AidB-like acyl-CoA dehydrogenase